MTIFRATTWRVFSLAACLVASPAVFGQVVINEIVDDERDASANALPDTREFIELYNAGASPVDISGWTVSVVDLATGFAANNYTIPSSPSIPSHGFYVIGQAGVPNVNYTPAAGELFYDLNAIFELRNPAQAGPTTLVDAVGLETFRGTIHAELVNATQDQLDQIAAGQTVGSSPSPPTGGWWGQMISSNAVAPNLSESVGRYLDGRDTNRNGYDFGVVPITPGASNNLPQNASHTVPNVDALTVGTTLSTNYHSSFVLPRVIDPTVASAINPNAITASPQGGRAIIAYDETGGGNASYSKELVNKFAISAYIDPRGVGLATSDTAPQSEASIYGIGTTDPFFGTPNSAGLLTGLPGGNLASSANGSTGLGWLIQRREKFNGGTPVTNTVLQLIDMNDGGDGVPIDPNDVNSPVDWQVKQTIDLTGVAQGWHNLSIDYNPTTGAVIAKYDAQTFNFNTITGMVGNFYVGYRENLNGNAPGGVKSRPPTYDLQAPTGTPGDYNNNGVVDAADYALWRDNVGNTTNVLANNPIFSVSIGNSEYTQWKANFGRPPGAGNGSSSGAVPEPAAISLAMLGLVLLAARRAKRGE